MRLLQLRLPRHDFLVAHAQSLLQIVALLLVFHSVALILCNYVVLAHLPFQVFLALLNLLGLLHLVFISLLLHGFFAQCIDLLLNDLGLSDVELVLRLDVRVTV